jgi:hypothetical protein
LVAATAVAGVGADIHTLAVAALQPTAVSVDLAAGNTRTRVAVFPSITDIRTSPAMIPVCIKIGAFVGISAASFSRRCITIITDSSTATTAGCADFTGIAIDIAATTVVVVVG